MVKLVAMLLFNQAIYRCFMNCCGVHFVVGVKKKIFFTCVLSTWVLHCCSLYSSHDIMPCYTLFVQFMYLVTFEGSHAEGVLWLLYALFIISRKFVSFFSWKAFRYGIAIRKTVFLFPRKHWPNCVLVILKRSSMCWHVCSFDIWQF